MISYFNFKYNFLFAIYTWLRYSESMAVILPIASGKGGVGKTVITGSAGVHLSNLGFKTVLIDLDLGGSNLHTCLGVRNRHNGMGAFINKQESNIEDIMVPAINNNLFMIPGDMLYPGTGNLPFFIKQKIIKQILEIEADYVLLDLGAGTAYNTVDFFLISSPGIIITTPETTSILNAYSFIKTAVFRLLFRSFKAKSDERKIIQEFVSQKLEGSGRSFSADLINELYGYSRQSGEIAESKLHDFFPWIVLNRVSDAGNSALGSKLKEITVKNIGIEVEDIGSLPDDQSVGRSIFSRKPAVVEAPDSPFSRELLRLIQKISSGAIPKQHGLYLDDEEILQIDAQEE